MKGRHDMANYRPTPTPYNNYRTMQMNMPAVCHDISDHMPLAMAYVPWQVWQNIYTVEKGFHCGTIFQDLNLPFHGKRGVRS